LKVRQGASYAENRIIIRFPRGNRIHHKTSRFVKKNSRKNRVAVLFGGQSTEHEVSLSSALGILTHINRDAHIVVSIKITKDGQWLMPDERTPLNTVNDLKSANGDPVLVGKLDKKGFFRFPKGKGEPVFEPVDVVFPILHGTFGEDGTIQGLAGLSDLPCVGAGVLASALGMDKIMMKQIFCQNNLDCPDFIWFLRGIWESKADVIREGVKKEIGFPCFVKPANTGSSVGISKAHDESELDLAIDLAARYDRKIMVEKAVQGRELECSILGNDDPSASVVGEIVPCNEFYDYDAKYLLDGSKTIVPASLPPAISETVRRMAMAAFKAVDAAGMSRVDFFLEKGTDRVFLNEINTIPGFTPISMYPKLWEASGISYVDLIDRLIDLAIERHADLIRSQFRKDTVI
jgi:D-alanine-D-alanine ligase